MFSDRIALTECETSKLLEMSAGRPLPLVFESRVWLKTNRAPWADTLVGLWRNKLVEQGAGI